MSADDAPVIATSVGAAGEDWFNQARITAYGATGTAVDEEGPAVNQADCSSLSYALYDVTADMSVINPSTALTVASQISNSLTDDDVWTLDTTGRNFLHNIAGSLLTKHNHRYRAVYTLTLTGGAIKKWAHERTILDLTSP